MRVCFRCDAGRKIGIGHLSRCEALASVLAGLRCDVDWASRSETWANRGPSRSDLQLPGEVSFDALGSDEAAAVGSWATGASWLVIDHYGAGRRYVDEVRATAKGVRILTIDDFSFTRGADLSVAPVLESSPGVLGGLAHALLRPAFSRAMSVRASSSRRAGLIVAMGGADTTLRTRRCLEALKGTDLERLRLTVIASSETARAQDLDGAVGDWRGGGQREYGLCAEEMAGLLARHELAVVSCSNVALEALAMGCSCAALVVADNQRLLGLRLAGSGVPVFDDERELAAAQESWTCSVPESGLVDGLGVWRVAAAMGFSKTSDS